MKKVIHLPVSEFSPSSHIDSNNTTSYPEDRKIQKLKKTAKKDGYQNPQLLKEFLHDKHELVRIEAVEILKEYTNLEAKIILEDKLQDVSALVRAYSAHSLSFIGDSNSIQKIEQALENEYIDQAKLDFLNAIYVLNGYKKAHFYEVCKFLNAKDKQVRIATGNTLKGHIVENKLKFIFGKLYERYKIEGDYHVQKSLWKNIQVALKYNSLMLKNKIKLNIKGLNKPLKPKPIPISGQKKS